MNTLKQTCMGEYDVTLDNNILGELTDPPVLRRRPRNTESLRRFWGRVAAHWPISDSTSSGWPLYLYYKSLISAGQKKVAYTITHYLRMIVHRWKKYSKNHGITTTEQTVDYFDDYVRHYLKQLSSIAFERIFTDGPGWMLLTHLHALTGKAPFTTEQILGDVTTWVADKIEGVGKQIDMDTFNRVLGRITTRWYTGEPDGHLSFREYCNDFFRWATSGGAPRVEIFGSKYRTKWAWAMKHSTGPDGDLLPEYDLYARAMAETQTAHVALKEEAQKTRSIITTPLSSYLRQCYLLYRWGKPKLPSPISSSTWLAGFEAVPALWYGCVDGERFDHTIPKSVIMAVVSALGVLDSETETVVSAELKHLDSLTLEWANHTWSWRGGLLSGWRFTSLIGTLVSTAAAEYIIEKNGGGGFKYGVMGDDVVIYSQTQSMGAEDLTKSYIDFGLRANVHKTVVGRVGEFLRKVRSLRGAWGYPALGLRSLVYAQPWISKYTYDNEIELSTSWLTYLSRLLPHSTCVHTTRSFIYQLMVDHLRGDFGKGINWSDWVQTPVSAGGGGCIEYTNMDKWCYLDNLRDVTNFPREQRIAYLAGVLKGNRVLKTIPRIIPTDMMAAHRTESSVVSTMVGQPQSMVRHAVSKTRLIYDIMYDRLTLAQINQNLTYDIPHPLRIVSHSRIVEYILAGFNNYTGITTITHTKETTSRLTHGLDYLIRSFIHSRSNGGLRTLPAAVTLHAIRTLRDIQLPMGTW